jgi:hypothetical protein
MDTQSLIQSFFPPASTPVPPPLATPAFMFVAGDVRHTHSDTQRLKNALRELNQKRLMNSRQAKAIKRKQRRVGDDGRASWVCPRCDVHAPRLTTAHVGCRASIIIDEVLREFPRRDFLFLDDAVRVRHAQVHLAVCCDACNKTLESGYGPVTGAHTEVN